MPSIDLQDAKALRAQDDDTLLYQTQQMPPKILLLNQPQHLVLEDLLEVQEVWHPRGLPIRSEANLLPTICLSVIT